MTIGTVRSILKIPNNWKVVRQPITTAADENIWMLMAPLTGRNIVVNASAKFRRRRKKLTATTRGTIPINSGWLTALATIATRKNCHLEWTQMKEN